MLLRSQLAHPAKRTGAFAWAVSLGLVFISFGGCEQKPAPPATAPADAPLAKPQQPQPELQILDYDGIQKLIASHAGKVVVMDAWSTSCPPCLAEFHNLVEIHKQYGPSQVACVSLSFDFEGGVGHTPEECRPRVLKFLTEQGATFDNLLSSEDTDALYKKIDEPSVPFVFVYDKSGKLRKRFDNRAAKTDDELFTYEQVKQLVAELVKE